MPTCVSATARIVLTTRLQKPPTFHAALRRSPRPTAPVPDPRVGHGSASAQGALAAPLPDRALVPPWERAGQPGAPDPPVVVALPAPGRPPESFRPRPSRVSSRFAY